jgi:hypothetical protein
VIVGCLFIIFAVHFYRGSIYRKIPPPPEGEMSADVIWRKIYEKGERKKGKM